jgi:hypothetical protein
VSSPLLPMYRIVKSSDIAATSSGPSILIEYGSSRVTSRRFEISIQQGRPSAQDKDYRGLWSSSLKIMLLLVFEHFTLLLLSVMLCYFPVKCLCWLLLISIQLGFGLLISVVYFWKPFFHSSYASKSP